LLPVAVRTLSVFLTAIFTLFGVYSVPVLADSSGGQLICEGTYALCSSAACTKSSKHPGNADCRCEGPLQGLNVGDSTCQSRAAKLTSTFSLWDLTATPSKPAKHSLGCTGDEGGEWAFCLDAPCEVGADGTVTCHCKVSAASEYYTFSDTCPADAREQHAICGKLWSGALQAELLSGYSQLWSFYADIPKLEYCPAH
jgi:hypothetical protein